jgi:spore germination protein GerM
VAAVGLMVAVAASCTSTSSTAPPSSTTTSTLTSTPSSTTTSILTSTTYSLYFLRGGRLGVAHRTTATTPAMGSRAVSALVGGPDSEEAAAGLSSAIPAGTRLLGLRIASGTATVDLSDAFGTNATPGAELARVAQVVFTLTQFPSVKTVAFEIAGSTPTTFASGAVSLRSPLGRSDVLGALPAILVESPAVGDRLHGSIRLSGLANVFEAQFNVQLIDGTGRLLLDKPVHATAGSGTWGTFDTTFSFTTSVTTTCTLRVYDVSAKDGSPVDEVDLHLVAGP